MRSVTLKVDRMCTGRAKDGWDSGQADGQVCSNSKERMGVACEHEKQQATLYEGRGTEGGQTAGQDRHCKEGRGWLPAKHGLRKGTVLGRPVPATLITYGRKFEF